MPTKRDLEKAIVEPTGHTYGTTQTATATAEHTRKKHGLSAGTVFGWLCCLATVTAGGLGITALVKDGQACQLIVTPKCTFLEDITDTCPEDAFPRVAGGQDPDFSDYFGNRGVTNIEAGEHCQDVTRSTQNEVTTLRFFSRNLIAPGSSEASASFRPDSDESVSSPVMR